MKVITDNTQLGQITCTGCKSILGIYKEDIIVEDPDAKGGNAKLYATCILCGTRNTLDSTFPNPYPVTQDV